MIKCLKNSAHICRSGNEYLSVVSKWGYTCILGDNAFNTVGVKPSENMILVYSPCVNPLKTL